MASTLTAKRGVVFPYVVKLFPQSGSEWLASPTLASGDFKITRYTSAGTYVDGPTNLANLPTVNPSASGNVLLLLSTTETQQGILMVEWKDQAGAEWGSGALEIHTTADDFDDVATVTDTLNANVTQISGDTTAADNLESFMDGTGYAGTNNVIPLVTTVTNLTNAPTSGDLTATMKTSITTAATAATPTVTVSDKTGFSLSSAGIQAIWDALTSALTTVGSVGKLLVDNINATIGSRSSHTAANVRTEMDSNSTKLANLDATISSRLASGSYTAPNNSDITAIKAKTDNLPATPAATGDIPTVVQIRQEIDSNSTQLAKLGTPAGASVSADIAAVKAETASIQTDTNDLQTQVGTAGAGLTAVASAANLATLTGYVDTEVAAIKAKTDNLPASPAATGDIPSASSIASAVWSYVAEGALTAVQLYRIIVAALAGKSTGGGTTSVAFRDVADSKNRIAATVDADGNRTAITLDGS